MPSYPSSLPAPLLADYTTVTAMGITGVRFERGNRRQRRSAKSSRLSFSLAFSFTMAELWAWQSWANRFGYDWHNMNLASPWSGVSASGEVLIPHTIRYISDIAFEAVAAGAVRATVQAEMDVTTLPESAVTPSGNWYVAGTPASPAIDTVTAGTPASPAGDAIVAGTPMLPAA